MKKIRLKILKPISLVLIITLFSCKNKDNYIAEDASIIADEVNSEDQKLFNIIREKDSLLFQIGFNQQILCRLRN